MKVSAVIAMLSCCIAGATIASLFSIELQLILLTGSQVQITPLMLPKSELFSRLNVFSCANNLKDYNPLCTFYFANYPNANDACGY